MRMCDWRSDVCSSDLPSDLTMSLGIFGQLDHPRFLDALQATVAAADKAGKAVGILLFDPEDYKMYYDMGIRFLACGSDATFVSHGAWHFFNTLNSSDERLLGKEFVRLCSSRLS